MDVTKSERFEQLDRLLTEHDGMLQTAQVIASGIVKPIFYEYVKEKNLQQVAHGIYVSEDTWIDAMFLLHLRCGQAVFSHESALFFHDLTDREPSPYAITVRRGYSTTRLKAEGLSVYTIKPELYEVGLTTGQTPFGHTVPIYDMERTICDLLRSRSSMEIQTFQGALKMYARRKDKDLRTLMRYAGMFRVEKILRQYLEVAFMIKTARQLKDLIRNLSREKSADAQLLMRNYMMERFLERISLSEYRDKFILKGGMLVAAMVGLDARSTMDLDATVKGANVNVEDIENLISAIVSVPIDDGVKFQLKSISEIMDEAEYPGIRVSMTTVFDGVVTPLKIDISTGDAITPREVRYSFKLMLEDRSIDIWAYNLETVLAEKLETIITRTTTNTRMRDFYDIYILDQLHGNTLNRQTLHDALRATAHKRGTEQHLAEAAEVFEEVENSPVMQKLWESYRRKFSYAADLEWNIIMGAVRSLHALSEKESSL